MPTLELSNTLLGYLTLLLNAATLFLLYLAFYPKSLTSFRVIASKYTFLFGFILTLGASLVTLYYSEILGERPCGLCWLERVFLYPQVVIFAIAALTKDARAHLYVTALSVIGAVIAVYHHYLQLGGSEMLPCPITGPSESCSTRIMFELGYITYPFMALSLFVFLIVLLLVHNSSKNPSSR